MSSGGEFIRMWGFAAFSRWGMAYFDTMKVPRVLTWCIRSKRRMSVSATGVRETALALFTTMSRPPKVATVRSIAALTCASSRTSTVSGSALPPAATISSAAVKMVPGSLGCGVSVLAAMTMLAPSRAARSAMASPMPREAPVMKSVRPCSDMIRSRQRRVGAVDAVGGLDHGALERAGLYRHVLREEARERGARRRVATVVGEPFGGERFLREQRPSSRQREQPQIGRRAGERRVEIVVLAAEQPVGRALERIDRILEPHPGPAESRVVGGVDRRDRAPDLADVGAHRGAAGERQLARDQVDRLDAVGALVDRRDARIAVMLSGAGLLHVAHAAVHLHAERGDLGADIGRECLGDGREQGGMLVRGLARRLVRAALRAVERDRGRVADRACGAGERAHGEQHALDVGMRDDRARTRLRAAGAALLALARIGERLLRRALGDRHALQRDREPRLDRKSTRLNS